MPLIFGGVGARAAADEESWKLNQSVCFGLFLVPNRFHVFWSLESTSVQMRGFKTQQTRYIQLLRIMMSEAVQCCDVCVGGGQQGWVHHQLLLQSTCWFVLHMLSSEPEQHS